MTDIANNFIKPTSLERGSGRIKPTSLERGSGRIKPTSLERGSGRKIKPTSLHNKQQRLGLGRWNNTSVLPELSRNQGDPRELN